MNEIIVVGQDEGAPLLHLQAVLTTGDSLAAVHLGGLEVLRTQPGLINRLGEEAERRREGRGSQRGDSNELVAITLTFTCLVRNLCVKAAVLSQLIKYAAWLLLGSPPSV